MIYPYTSLWINGRDVLIEDIRSESAIPDNDFETSVFSFVKDWLAGRQQFIINTSGSTGTPKEIVITRHQMMASARMTAQALNLQEGQASFICLDAKYIAGMMMLVRSLVTSMKIMCVTPSANPFKDLSLPAPIDFMALVPYQVYELVHSEEDHWFYIPGKVLIGSAPLDTETQNHLQRYTCSFYATYGMTETISHIALQELNGPQRSDAFHALNEVVIALDERGCLTIEAPYLPDKIITNDMVDITSPSTFMWLGRWDNVINTGGVKVIPENVERQVKDVLLQHNIHVPYFIAGIPDIQLGLKVVLVLESEEISEDSSAVLLKSFKNYLSKFEAPKAIVCISKFIYTHTGKLSRHKTIEIPTK